jgi:hypothetical protein
MICGTALIYKKQKKRREKTERDRQVITNKSISINYKSYYQIVYEVLLKTRYSYVHRLSYKITNIIL